MIQSDSYTHDSISLRGAGVVTIVQQKKGARFSLDSLLLADFCRVKSWDRILEPGAGTGVISLLLAKKYPRSHIVAVEIQSTAAKLFNRNIAENGLEDRITVLEQDIRTLRSSLKPSTFDVVVANPPYRRTGTGRQSPGPERLSSRHDRLGSIDAWLDLHRFLKNRGLYVLVFAADRLTDLMASLRLRKLEPKRMRFVHPYQDKPASLVLVEAVKSAGTGLQILPPLVVHETIGGYTGEMKEIYALP
jgi:tRNA1Val (adenine37-N6)-methyltransferase